jgi:hypothetical protein
MAIQSHWNPAKELDKVERPDMSGMGARHVRPESLETGLEPDMSSLTGVFGGVIDF